MKVFYFFCVIGFAIAIGCLTVLFGGCTKPAPTLPVSTSKGGQTTEFRPFCEIDNDRKSNFTGGKGGAVLETWEIRASRVKRLAARVLLIRKGKITPVNEVEYKWDSWEPGDRVATGQLMLLSEDAQPGNDGWRLPLLALQIQNCPSPISQVRSSRSGLTVNRELAPFASAAVYDITTRKQYLANQVYAPQGKGGSASFGSTLEDIVSNSSNGREVVSLEFEWEPL